MNVAKRTIQPAGAAPSTSDFSALLERVHAIGRDTVAPHSESVDREARFPLEAFAALRAEKLLSAYIPVEYGGMGLPLAEIAKLCDVLGQYCASTAMIFAMHQIQIACIVHHALGTPFFRDYAREISAKQHLVASATTELGIGGDTRSSNCAVKVVDAYFMLDRRISLFLSLPLTSLDNLAIKKEIDGIGHQ